MTLLETFRYYYHKQEKVNQNVTYIVLPVYYGVCLYVYVKIFLAFVSYEALKQVNLFC